MYKDVLRSIEHVATFPVVALIIFFSFFAGVIWFAMRLRKSDIEDAATLPMRDGALKIMAMLLLFAPAFASAEPTAEPTMGGVSSAEITRTLLAATIIIAFVCLIFAYTVMMMVRQQQQQKDAAAGIVAEPSNALWKRLYRRFVDDAVPVEQESDIDLGHNYDGIRELDNNLPPWWKYGFYLTIVFSVFYMWYFHFSSYAYTQKDEYNEEMVIAKAEKDEFLKKAANSVDENTVTMLADASRISNGKALFATNCVVCHGDKGEGKVGPNLTDAYWIHGGSIKNVFKTVKYGVPEKGMIAWEATLRPAEIQDISSYILSLQGTNPANAKEAQGDLYQEAAAAPSDTLKAATTAP